LSCAFPSQDHFRKSRKPSYTNVFHDRGGVIGVVEFETREDLKAAIRDLDGEIFALQRKQILKAETWEALKAAIQDLDGVCKLARAVHLERNNQM